MPQIKTFIAKKSKKRTYIADLEPYKMRSPSTRGRTKTILPLDKVLGYYDPHLSQVEFHSSHENLVFVGATYIPQQDKTKIEAATATSIFSFGEINSNEKKRPGAASLVLRAGIMNKKFVDSVTYQHRIK